VANATPQRTSLALGHRLARTSTVGSLTNDISLRGPCHAFPRRVLARWHGFGMQKQSQIPEQPNDR
jgi:hypothetical protein